MTGSIFMCECKTVELFYVLRAYLCDATSLILIPCL